MRRRRVPLRLFGLAFLDVLSCALGAVLSLLLLARIAEGERSTAEVAAIRAETLLDTVLVQEAEARAEADRIAELLEDLERAGERASQETDLLRHRLYELRGVRFVGVQTDKSSIVLLLDLSASMEHDGATLQRAAATLVGLLRYDEEVRHRFAVLAFQDEDPPRIRQWLPGRGFEDASTAPLLLDATVAAREEAANAIEALTPFEYVGATPTVAGFRAASAALRSEPDPADGAIFLLSDGEPGDASLPRGAQARRAAALSSIRALIPAGADVRCVGIGERAYEDPGLIDFLRDLARPRAKGFVAL